MNCLIDTGSQATLVNLSLVRDLKLEPSIRRTKYVLSSFTKNSIATVGEVTLDLTIAGTRTPHTCIVVREDMECNVLLGMDFMSTNDICIHGGNNKITSPNGSAPFISPPTPIRSRTRVRATTTVIVPPNTVMFIRGSLEEQKADRSRVYSGYLEPYENLAVHSCLFAAGALMYSEEGEVPVRVMNPTDEPIVVYGRKLLGFMKPAETKTECIHNIRVQRIADTTHSWHTIQKPTERVGDWTKERLFRELRLDGVRISAEEKRRLEKIVWDRRSCFSTHEFDLGTCNFFEAEIKLKPGATPQYVPPIPTPYKRKEMMEKHLDGMEKSGIIEELQGHDNLWNSRVFLVPKPNQPGHFRFVADFRALNSQCLPDQYQLPNINHVVDRIGGAKWYSTFDLSKSFYQVDYKDNSRMLTAFTANNKRYIFKKMVMGHMTSSSQFAKMMDRLLANIPLDQLCYFLDDLCLASNDVTAHLDRLELVLDKLKSSNMKLMPKKCEFLKREVRFVGLTISQEGIKIHEERVKAVVDIPPPRSVKEAQQVMGFLSYNRKFVRNFAELAKPIYNLIDKQKKFVWSRACQDGLDEIKRRIAEGITLTIPQVDDPSRSYIVTMDASQDGYGAELSQLQNGERKVVAYFSKRVPQHKRQWSQSKLEFEAMVEAIEHWAIYLKGTQFLVKTDCLSLVALEKLFAKTNATMIRRLNKLADYRFSLQHLAGTENGVADFLSRYLHKKRECSRATQTDIVESVSSEQDCEEIVNCNLIETDLREDSDTPAEPLIPEDFFTAASYGSRQGLDRDRKRRTVMFEEVDYSSITTSPACICESQVVPVEDPTEEQATVVNAVTAGSITEQLDIPTLLDLNRIREEQKNDVILTEVRKWIEKGEKPRDLQKLRLPPELIRYWKQFNLLAIRGDVLVRKWIRHNKKHNDIEIERFLVLVPESLRETVLRIHHDTLLTTHPGIEGTYQQVTRQYYWPQMRDEVDLFVKSCIKCGWVKQPSAYLKAPLKHVIAYSFNDAIAIDHIVPEKEGATPRRNRYILTLTDVFTGYIVAVPCKTRESEETIRIILHHWALRFGYPREILADNDTSFTSGFFNAVLAYFKIKPTHGLPYLCASTSKVERSNKRINTALRLTLTTRQIRDWDLYLNFVCFALNGLRSRHTGFSANFLLYGKHLNTPLDLEVGGESVVFQQKSKQHGKAYELYRTIRTIVQKARKHAALDFQYADNSYNKNLHGPYFEEKDWCFTLINCPTHKFSERWQGPYRICKKISDHLYVVELDNGTEKVVNISKLKRYTRSKYSPQLNPKAQEFAPATDETPAPPTSNSPDEHPDPGTIEVDFTPVNCRQEPGTEATETLNSEVETQNQAQEDDWIVVEEDTTEDPVEEEQEVTTAVNPPDPDPTGPQTEAERRYPSRSRTRRNPLQLLWGTRSYE